MKDDNYWEDIETCLIKNYVVKIQFKKCFTDDVITVHIMGYDMKRSFNYINISYINQIWILTLINFHFYTIFLWKSSGFCLLVIGDYSASHCQP